MDKIKVAIRARPLNKREVTRYHFKLEPFEEKRYINFFSFKNEIGSTEIVTINENQVILNDSASNKDG